LEDLLDTREFEPGELFRTFLPEIAAFVGVSRFQVECGDPDQRFFLRRIQCETCRLGQSDKIVDRRSLLIVSGDIQRLEDFFDREVPKEEGIGLVVLFVEVIRHLQGFSCLLDPIDDRLFHVASPL